MRRSITEFSIWLASLAAMIALAILTAESPAQVNDVGTPAKRSLTDLSLQPVAASKPYSVTSRFHLMEGTTSGYLVLEVQLSPGNYMYSLSQAGAINPTKIQVVPSEGFFIDGKFNPDRPAEVIENDPVFNQRVEKHKGKVQFFVPVKFNSVEAAGTVKPEIILNGQVCSTDGVCMAIRDKRVQAEFGGFFGRTVEVPDNGEKRSLR